MLNLYSASTTFGQVRNQYQKFDGMTESQFFIFVIFYIFYSEICDLFFSL